MENVVGLEVKSSRLPGFYKLGLAERAAVVAEWAGLNEEEHAVLAGNGLQPRQADLMIENVVGTYALPLGIAANFFINGRDYLIPMAVEEPSVLAAISHAAKLIRAGGGFQAESTDPIMIGQIQVLDMPDLEAARQAVLAHSAELMALADEYGESIVRYGGGARGLEARPFPETAVGPMLVVHLLYDTRDAMGANTVNTAVEAIAPRVAELTGGRAVLRILSNLADRRTTTARCTIPAGELTIPDMPGHQVARLIAEANAFAVADPYRAATHNKGIMNGIDAVCIATGNDWRAIEAGAHSYAAFYGKRPGVYSALTDWHVDDNGDLYGEITLPLAVGTVGGATKVHPTARVAMKILAVETAAELAEVMASVGLAQNLAAIRALATHGIQRGHMRLHARQVALAAGAPEDDVQRIADLLVSEGNIRVERARELLAA